MRTNRFQIRVLAFVIAALLLSLIIVIGLGTGVADYLPVLSPPTVARTPIVFQETVIVQGPVQLTLVAPNPTQPTLSLDETSLMATRDARLDKVNRLAPFPTLTPTNLLSPLTKSPSFRLDIWLSTLVVLTGFLLITGLEIRKRSRKKNTNPMETR